MNNKKLTIELPSLSSFQLCYR